MTRTRLGRNARRLAVLAGAWLLLGWAAGLAWFVTDARRPSPPPPRADGIVALTGGAGRVEAALHLLLDGRADALLISGAGGGAALPELARMAGVDAAPLAERVTVGREARSTAGNAEETAAWVARLDARSLIVVTADYHMRRALLELGRALPGVALWPMKVRTPASARLLLAEYCKYLLARLGAEPGAPPVENSVGRCQPHFARQGSQNEQRVVIAYLFSVHSVSGVGNFTVGTNAGPTLG